MEIIILTVFLQSNVLPLAEIPSVRYSNAVYSFFKTELEQFYRQYDVDKAVFNSVSSKQCLKIDLKMNVFHLN